MEKKKILITGITGNVGSETAKFLIDRGEKVRAAVRGSKIEELREVFGDSMEYADFDFTRPETYKQAFCGVDRLFLMRPPAISDVKKYINPAIDAAIECGVSHIVFLSLMGVEKNPIVPHYKIEKHLLKSNVDYTFLRPGFFMQNLTGIHRDDIKNENDILVPAGKGRTSFIDCRDIAEVAAVCLCDDVHRNKEYTLTGKEALDYFQVADIFSEVLGRKIVYSKPSMGKYRKRMKEIGIAGEFITVMQGIYLTVRLGLGKRVTDDVEKLLGRPPISMKQFVSDNSYLWK